MGYYKEFTITAQPFNTEIISSILWELDITGINEEVNCIKVFANANAEINKNRISGQLQKLVDQKLLLNFDVEEYILEEVNWNEEWEKTINVIEVSDKIVVKPTFREYTEKNGQIVITIDPKMSFGTGEHQTTKLVLRLMEKYAPAAANVLDIGSGTGILAISAVKLGANRATAIDNDEWCFDNANENCLLNNVSKNVKVIKGEISDISEAGFDLILANIQKNILIDIVPLIKSKAAKNAVLILSGLLFTDEEEIVSCYKKFGFNFLEKTVMDEWIALVMKL